MTVAELLGRISSQELTEWRAFFLLESEREKAEQKKAEAAARHGR